MFGKFMLLFNLIELRLLLTPEVVAPVVTALAVAFAFRSLKKQPDAPVGFTMISSAFICEVLYIIAVAIYSNIASKYSSISAGNAPQELIDSIKIIYMAMFCGRLFFCTFLLCAVLKFFGKACGSFMVFLLLFAAASIAYVLAFIIKGESIISLAIIVYLPAILCLATGVSLYGRQKTMKEAVGFKLASLSFVFLAVYKIIPYVSFGSAIKSAWYIASSLDFLLVFSALLIIIDLLRHQFSFLETEIIETRNRLKLIIQSSPFPIIISRLKDDRLMLLNKKAGELFKVNYKKPGNFRAIDFFADPSERTKLLKNLETVSTVEDFEILMQRPGLEEKFWIMVSARVIDFDNEIALYATFQDITGRKKKEIKLYDQATRDPLTGCFNRRQFEELASTEVQRARRYGHTFCIIMIDADHFKNVNDTYGHSVGDIVLKDLAKCCNETLRETDIIARFGGEEFIILLPEIMMEEALFVANRLRVKISKLIVHDEKGGDVSWTVSMGVAESSITDDPDELIKLADAALYVAKEKGRNRVEYAPRKDGEKDIEPYSPDDVHVEEKSFKDDFPLEELDADNLPLLEKTENDENIENLPSLDESAPKDEKDLSEHSKPHVKKAPHLVKKVPPPPVETSESQTVKPFPKK